MFPLSVLVDWPAKIAGQAFDYLFGFLVQECTYVIQCRKNVDELDEQLKDYVSPFEGAINDATYGFEEINEARIEDLKKKEAKIKTGAKELSDKYHKVDEKNHLRFCGYIPNPISRHDFGKKASEWKIEIKKLREGKPDGLTKPDEPPGKQVPASTEEDYLPESRAEILNPIIEALQDPNIQKIGVWGAPHMGKTILRKKLVQRALVEKLFDIRAESEKDDDVQKIQDDIADCLTLGNLSQVEGPRKKQQAIRRMIMNNRDEKVLIILDGLSKKINLDEVGIPSEASGKVCKVVLMSADQDLLVNNMGVLPENLFRLGVLSNTESKALFQAVVGEMHENDPGKKTVAENIAEESAGFPDLIACEARNLKNQPSLATWKVALNRIRSESPKRIQTHIEEILTLNSDAEKLRTLIYLCRHLGGSVISIQDLTLHGRGLGLFDDIDTLADTRNHVKNMIKILRDYHLVEENQEYVEVKDLIRKVAMPQEEQRRCIKLPIDRANIPDDQCLELKMLLIHAGDSSRDHIPKKFFTNAKELTVLHLTNINFASSPIPSSIKHLTKLQTLYLDCCKLTDVRIIGSLVNLQHLSFSGSDIVQLPKQLENLTDLRMLDLRRCHKLQVIEASVFKKLTKLEELYLDERFDKWEVRCHGANPRGEGNKRASLDELSKMNKLSTLHINVTDTAMLPQELPFETLESYKILLGNIQDFSKEENEKPKALKLSLQDSTTAKSNFLSRRWMKNILESSENLCLEGSIDNVDSVEELSSNGFKELKHLHVQDSPNIKCILEGKSVTAFTVLESLTLAKLTNLNKICFDNPDSGSFNMLRVLKIQHCDALEVMSKLSFVHITSNIEKIEVSECKKIKGIVMDETADKTGRKGHTATEEKGGWHNLKHLALSGLPEMMSFITVEKATRKSSETTSDTPTAFFDGKQISLPRLESLALVKLPQVKEIWLQNIPSADLANLQHLQVGDCKSLESVIKHNHLTMLEKLKSVTIKNCPLVEEAFQIDYNVSESLKPSTPPQPKSCLPKLTPGRSGHRNGKDEQKPVNGNPEIDTLPHLVELNLIELQNLKCLWKSSPRRMPRFQELSYLVLRECHKLKHLFSASMAKGLPRMSHLCIENCDMLQVIIIADMADEESEPQRQQAMTSNSVDLKLTSLSLQNLKNLATFSRGVGSLRFPSLKTLNISNCPIPTALYNASQQGLMAEGADSDRDGAEYLGVRELFEHTDVFMGIWVHSASDANFQDGSLFNQMATPSFPLLEDLVISEMDFRNVWQGQVSQESFPKLSEVAVKACKKLTHIFPQDMLKSFCNIKRLCISNCDSLKNILGEREWIETSNASEVVAQLREIYLEGLETLEHILPTVDPKGRIIPFTKLQIVSVSDCNTVDYLFPVSLAKDLSELNRLEVNMCDGLEQIIKDDEPKATDGAPTFKFRDLKFLAFRRLKNLKNLYAKQHISHWPALTQLIVVECGSIEIFCSTDDFSPSQQCLFWVDENPFSELEILELHQNQLMGKIWQGQLPLEGLLSNLKVFKVMSPREKPATFPPGFFQCLANLEVLEVSICQFPDYKSQDEQPKGVPVSELPQLILSTFRHWTSLFHLIKASLTILGEQETQQNELIIANNAGRISQRHTAVLQELKLTMLPEVKDLPEGLSFLGISQNSLQRLMDLEVSECHHLKYLLTIEMAKSLPHLTRLTVAECKLMEGIVAEKKDGPQENVVYNFLKCLTLDSLPEIKSFTAGNASFRCSSPEEVTVRRCPKLKKFTSVKTPNLDKVKIEGEEKILSDYDGTLNTVIKKSYAEMAAFPGMEYVKLSEFPEWMEKWGNLQVKTSCLMRILEISNCHSLSVAVPSGLTDLLGHLRELRVKNCNSLTEVFDLSLDCNQTGGNLLSNLSEIHPQNLDERNHTRKPGQSPNVFSFGNLTSLEVENCKRLKSIFTIQIALRLRSLRDMTIGHCTDLKYIISSDEDERLTEETTVFPELKSLVLIDLPHLESFHVDHLNLLFKPLKYKPKVYDCPNVKGIYKMYSSDAGYADDRLNHLPTSPLDIYRSMALYILICLICFSFWIIGPASIQGSITGPFQK